MQKERSLVHGSKTYNLGARKNFIQVFGGKWYRWFLPVYSSEGDGCNWETREAQNSRTARTCSRNRHNP
ncbi:unnamed protein product [Acanthoscelides obtectus]|uniref:Uncharacterized protein n=1 Tax=Acanthoscelides obtectus TaxID=200917 RepID=A0A9P0P3N3_ACAOB|nr:unnamed protein product [Acanthoscelides obtectus]CAK1683087.1 hypothetical protein AOBTE_LOCUS34071 [Acanthoscelides obtectus]